MKFAWLGGVVLVLASSSVFAEEGAQVLTYRDRKLVVTWKQTPRYSDQRGNFQDRDRDRGFGFGNNRDRDREPAPSVSPSPAPSPTPPAQPEELEVFIEYTPTDRISVGKIEPSVKTWITVPLSVYRDLATTRPHSVAQVVVQSTTDKTMNGRHVVSKVFIGGKEDLTCENPILISDLNGTLDRRDDCTVKTINALMKETGLTVFVVSTLGASAIGQVNALHFEHADRVLVLGEKERESSVSSSSSYGYGYSSSAGTDKAQRLKDHLWPAGACIVGFSGESPDIEGAAAIKAGIPYLAVNQHDRALVREERRTKPVCIQEVKEKREWVRLDSNNRCPDGYDRTEVWESVCENDAGEEKILIIGSTASFYFPPQKSLAEGRCKSAGLKYKDHRRNVYCKLWRQATSYTPPREIEPLEDGTCPEGFKLQNKDVLVRVPVGSEPSVDMTKFPEGSFYSRDWCEMKPHLEELIRKLRTE